VTVLIPLAPGTVPHHDTLASIDRQSVPCSVISHSTPWIETGERLADKRANEIANRNWLLEYASVPYALYLDNGVVFSGPRDVADCAACLDAHPELDAVALDTKHQDIHKAETDHHVCVACLMIRTVRWKGYRWTASLTRCGCRNVNETFTVRYVDNRRLSEAK
jgi:hypothetical protein